MKLCNAGNKVIVVELFLGPGDWFKAEVASGASVEIADELAEAAKVGFGLVEVAKPAEVVKAPKAEK